MDEIFNFATDLIEIASKVILKNLNSISKISYKQNRFNLVTNVDYEVESKIIKKIISKYPNHSIIAEESGKHKKDPAYKWFIDPIDGTTNFAHGYPCFCISIGFSKNDVLEFGLVKNPVTGELYSARKNKGAKLNGKKISVSNIRKLKDSLLITGFADSRKKTTLKNFTNFQKLTLITHGVRRDGAAALDLCYIASGRAEAFWESNLNPWDVAAGVLIIKEAGGTITDFNGNKYDIFNDKIVTTNGWIHRELLKHLH